MVLSPKEALRGGHVAFCHDYGYALSRAMIDYGIICDYRDPDLIRLCVNPLYLSMDDMRKCIDILGDILDNKLYLLPKYQQKVGVT